MNRAALRHLLFSSRPRWAMMPRHVSDSFADTLLFFLSALEEAEVQYVAHFGTLLGALRLGGTLPWDEDADIYLIGEDRQSVEQKLRPLLERHALDLIYDHRDFFWVRERPWWAGQGHIGLSFMPEILPAGTPRPTDPADARIAHEELYPLRRYPYYSTTIWGPRDGDAIAARLYGESGSAATMRRFVAPEIARDTAAFWAQARSEQGNDWTAISARRLAQLGRVVRPHVLSFPWWWFNGAYNIGIKRLRAVGERAAAKAAR